jgi:hypothetical protein
LKEKVVAAPVWKVENTAVGIRHADHVHTLSANVGTNFADKWRSPGRYRHNTNTGNNNNNNNNNNHYATNRKVAGSKPDEVNF